MDKKQLRKIIEEGENISVEFKREFSSYEKIAKEMIALANTKGGLLILGVDDNRSIYGLLSEKGDAELLHQTAENYCVPPIKLSINHFEIEGLDIIAAYIPPSENPPHRIQDYEKKLDLNSAQVYIRVNDSSVLASKEMIKILQAKAGEIPLKNYEVGKNEKIVFDYLEDHETITVKELSEIANLSGRRASRTLIKMVRADLLYIHTKENGESYYSSAL